MAIYYQVRNSPNRRMKPADKILELTKQINGIINTERYLKDDPVAQPDPDIINASDVSLSFFQEGISEAWVVNCAPSTFANCHASGIT